MDDAFITQHFDWNRPGGFWRRAANAALRLLRSDCRFVSPRDTGARTSVEERINLFHLVSQVLAYGVPGDLVEVGTRCGESAALIETVIAGLAPDRRLHVFPTSPGGTPDVAVRSFRLLRLRPPAVHAGPLPETLIAELPESVSFAHVDVGFGQPAAELRAVVRHCLDGLYPRLAPGAVLLLADYSDPNVYNREGFSFPWALTNGSLRNPYPPIKAACDEFFADKPERVASLFAGHYSHGYLRKR